MPNISAEKQKQEIMTVTDAAATDFKTPSERCASAFDECKLRLHLKRRRKIDCRVEAKNSSKRIAVKFTDHLVVREIPGSSSVERHVSQYNHVLRQRKHRVNYNYQISWLISLHEALHAASASHREGESFAQVQEHNISTFLCLD